MGQPRASDADVPWDRYAHVEPSWRAPATPMNEARGLCIDLIEAQQRSYQADVENFVQELMRDISAGSVSARDFRETVLPRLSALARAQQDQQARNTLELLYNRYASARGLVESDAGQSLAEYLRQPMRCGQGTPQGGLAHKSSIRQEITIERENSPKPSRGGQSDDASRLQAIILEQQRQIVKLTRENAALRQARDQTSRPRRTVTFAEQGDAPQTKKSTYQFLKEQLLRSQKAEEDAKRLLFR